MKKYGLFFMCICFLSTLSAQSGKNITFNVRTGDDVNVLLSSDKFLFSDYQEAFVVTNKGVIKSKMNYNMITDEMMFITPDNDTLVLANPKDVRSIRIGKQEFVYTSKGYLQVLTGKEDKALLISRRIKPSAVKEYGGYGMTTSTSSVEHISHINNTGMGSNKFDVKQKVSYSVNTIYYLEFKNRLYTGATEKNFVRAFGKAKKDLISQYIQDNALDLKNETHLIQLFNFCAE